MAFQNEFNYLINTGAVRSISSDTALIHDGKGFVHHNLHTVTTGSNLDHLLITPTDRDVHLRGWSVKSDQGPITINAYEDTIVSANGVAEPTKRLNRQSSIQPSLLIYSAPTITGVGTTMITEYIGTTGGGAHTAVGESANSPLEWFLKRGSKYLLRAANTSGATANIVISFFWYEL